MIGPYYVGDIPLIGLTLTVTRNGEVIDPSVYASAEVTLTDPAGITSAWGGTVSLSPTAVLLNFPTTSPFSLAGLYQLNLTLISTDVRERFDSVGIEVLPTLTPDHWCTAAEVYAITRREVTRDNLTKAHYDIEIVSGRLFQYLEDGILCDDDRDWLKRAVAHQAVFVTDHPAKDSSIEVTSVSEGRASMSPTYDGLILGPMARRALKNVSWVGARTVGIGKGPQTGGLANLTSIAYDIPEAPWGPA